MTQSRSRTELPVKPEHVKEQSTFVLFKLLYLAAMYRMVARIPLRIRQRVMTICGLIALMWPLALWIAFSKVILISVNFLLEN